LIKDGALLETVHEYNSNVKKAAVLEKIDFQHNTSTELYRADQFFNDFTVEGFWGIQLTSNAAGDTLAVFVNTVYITNFGNLSSLLAINIKQKKIEQEIALPGVFYKDDGVLIVKDGQAWLSQTLGEFSASICNFSLQNGLKNWEITTNNIDAIKFVGGKIITFNDLGTYAFQANTGEIIWQNEGTIRNPIYAKSSWFELNGQYFMIRGNKLVQLDLETGCTLKNQSIEFASEPNWAVFMQKDPLLNVLYVELHTQMLSIQL
jgi:outer membrane protein assembly factor BamB